MAEKLLSTDPKAGQLLSQDPSAAVAASATPTPAPRRLTMPEIGKLPPREAMAYLQQQELERKQGGTQALIGAGKQVANTVFQGGDLIRRGLGMERVIDRPEVQAGITSANAEQRLGAKFETAAEIALGSRGLIQGAKALLPSTARAGAKFQRVMGAAKDVPVPISDSTSNVALDIMDFASRGATMPQAVTKFIARATKPFSAPMTYKEARDFEMNLSRLSALEMTKIGHNKPLLNKIFQL